MGAAFVEKNCKTCKGSGMIDAGPAGRVMCQECKGWGTTVVKV